MEMVKANKYQLSRMEGNKFNDDVKAAKLLHEGTVVSRSFVEEFNLSWQSSGKLYVIDEYESKRVNDYIKKKRAANEEIDKLVAQSAFNNNAALSPAKREGLIDKLTNLINPDKKD